jgi:hypothetical protein
MHPTNKASESTRLLADQHHPVVEAEADTTVLSNDEDVESGYFPTHSTNIYQDPTPEDLSPEPEPRGGGGMAGVKRRVSEDEEGERQPSPTASYASTLGRVVIVTKLKHLPQILECKSCGYQGMTLIKKKPSCMTYLCSGVLSIFCLCWIPWCFETCHGTQHVCAYCNQALGYKKPCC